MIEMEEKKIVLKEIDKLVSVVSPTRVVTEYMVYLMVNEQKVAAYLELGEEAKSIRVNELIIEHFIGDEHNGHKIIISNIVEEVSFEDMYNIKKRI
jgi:hypothetical protein